MIVSPDASVVPRTCLCLLNWTKLLKDCPKPEVFSVNTRKPGYLKPLSQGRGTPILSLLPVALLGFLYSNCGFSSPFLLHWISQKIFQNSSHNYHGTTVNSLQFPRAQHPLFLKTAVYWPSVTQLWCDEIWGPQLWVKCLGMLGFRNWPEFILLSVHNNGERGWKLVFLQVSSTAQAGSYLLRTVKLPNPIQRKVPIVRISQGAGGRDVCLSQLRVLVIFYLLLKLGSGNSGSISQG